MICKLYICTFICLFIVCKLLNAFIRTSTNRDSVNHKSLQSSKLFYLIVIDFNIVVEGRQDNQIDKKHGLRTRNNRGERLACFL